MRNSALSFALKADTDTSHPCHDPFVQKRSQLAELPDESYARTKSSPHSARHIRHPLLFYPGLGPAQLEFLHTVAELGVRGKKNLGVVVGPQIPIESFHTCKIRGGTNAAMHLVSATDCTYNPRNVHTQISSRSALAQENRKYPGLAHALARTDTSQSQTVNPRFTAWVRSPIA